MIGSQKTAYVMVLLAAVSASADASSRLRVISNTLENSTGHHSARVLGGRNASYSDKSRSVPWQVGIQIWNEDIEGYETHCGGSIVSEYWILSAAHCFFYNNGQRIGESLYSVTVGDINNAVKDNHEQRFDVARILTHPSYKKYGDGTIDYDLAYVNIKSKDGRGIKFNRYVEKVFLPGPNIPPFPHNDCFISGWGRTSNEAFDNGANILQVAKVHILNQEGQKQCNESYYDVITDRMLCAGYMDGTKIDTCEGDSGGPLVCKIRGEQKHALGYKIMTKATDPRHKRSPRKIKRKHLRIKWVYTDVWNRATKNLRLANASRNQEQVLSTPYPKPPETKTESSTAFTVPQPIMAATEKPPEVAGIIAGKPATFSDVPWQAGIRLISGTLDVHHCGGIIVSSLWILTAAHCFMDSQNVSSYRVRVGDIDNTVKELSEMEYAVEQIIVHPSFTSDVVFYDYDIALVKIVPINNLGIQFNDNVKSVLVPGTNTQIFPLTGCTISGWGRTTQVISDPGATVLQKANVDVFNTTGQAECNTAYANMITDRMLCAGPQDGSGVDACVGDSGGPLVCKIQGHDVVVGVTSWGTTVCGVAGFPGVYANIQYFLDWLYNPY